MQPRVSVTTKAINRPLNFVEAASIKEKILCESFQLLCYYLSNVLYSILPLLSQALRFHMVRTGRFSYLENPL